MCPEQLVPTAISALFNFIAYFLGAQPQRSISDKVGNVPLAKEMKPTLDGRKKKTMSVRDLMSSAVASAGSSGNHYNDNFFPLR